MIALFPVKAQPPHLGHFITILKHYNNYDKFIVGVTEDGNFMSQKERINIFKVLEKIDKIKVIKLKGILIEYNDDKYLPYFDVCLSGNKNVLNKVRELGYKSRYVKRSGNYSGTEIRDLRWKK